jgi:hypothetical protein
MLRWLPFRSGTTSERVQQAIVGVQPAAQLRVDEADDVEQVGVAVVQRLGQQRLVVGHAVAQHVQPGDRSLQQAPVGSGQVCEGGSQGRP